MRLVLQKLGLTVNEEEQAVPPLSRLHLSSHTPADVTDLVASWDEIFTVIEGEEYIRGGNDVFCVEKEGKAWEVEGLKEAVESVLPETPTDKAKSTESKEGDEKPLDEPQKPKTPEEQIHARIAYTSTASPDSILDYEKLIKRIAPHSKHHPSSSETPCFHHEAYYANLAHYHAKARNPNPSFGTRLLYGEVMTSTNTLLEKNPSLLARLPTGFTAVATTQLAGRGRGSNVWVAPRGALLFSTVIHHPFALTQAAPVVFVQYLAALAIVQGVLAYAPGYETLGVKLKWPNDVYAVPPGGSAPVKIGGILVNSSYAGGNYALVVGIGLNVANPLPTTSLDQLAAHASPPLRSFAPEKLLASILARFDALYGEFCAGGFTRGMEAEYYAHWLHAEQVVTLETHDGLRARIKGITRDWGLLLAEELGWDDRGTGRMVALQSDSNSFDFFKGLIRRKV